MTVQRLCSCGQVLLEVGNRLVCQACGCEARAWSVRLDGEVVARRHVCGEVEVAPQFREALRTALAEGGEVLPAARIASPRRRAGRWVA